jgi:hypothetical protein
MKEPCLQGGDRRNALREEKEGGTNKGNLL